MTPPPRAAVSPRMARRRQQRQRAVPLLVQVQAFVALGVPVDTGGRGVACFYCAGDLLVDGHGEQCAWIRLRDRVAE